MRQRTAQNSHSTLWHSKSILPVGGIYC